MLILCYNFIDTSSSRRLNSLHKLIFFLLYMRIAQCNFHRKRFFYRNVNLTTYRTTRIHTTLSPAISSVNPTRITLPSILKFWQYVLRIDISLAYRSYFYFELHLISISIQSLTQNEYDNGFSIGINIYIQYIYLIFF